MGKSTDPVFPVKITGGDFRFDDSHASQAQLICTAGTEGAVIFYLNIVSSASVDKTVTLSLDRGTAHGANPQGQILVQDGAGTNGVDLPVNALDATYIPAITNGTLHLEPGEKVYVALDSALAANEYIYVTLKAGGYDLT